MRTPKNTANMYSNKPYLVKAFYQWIVDSDCTPYMMVDAKRTGVEVPTDYVQNGQIVLNVKPESVKHLVLGMRKVTFLATFGGVEYSIYLPMEAIQAVYAMENGDGMMFETKETSEDYPPDPDDIKQNGKPDLRIVE